MSFQGIKEAYNRIGNIINKTPVMTSRTLNSLMIAEIYFKCENFQRVGAFKFRGAYNTLSLLCKEERKQGVITHSSGNHAQAVALAASILGIQATIIMPKGAPINKINATKGYGAKIVFCDNNLKSRTKTTEELIEKNNLILIHPFDNYNIINGAGTAVYELINEIGNFDIIIAPLGGGGLLSGTAIATKELCPDAQVIGVEPSIADDALKSLKAGYIIPSTYPDTIADGLRTSISEKTFNFIRKYVDQIVTVSEIKIVEAMRFLWERMKIIVEPSGAVPLAAVLSKKVSVENKKIGLILSGGNIDLEPFFQILEKNVV
ncbi:MAG: pyridoxal-phosphate dependent enzyme [Candidatus Lokiarchaeota archaeon]|nr:pyridoxal-phosphate dependent enzyme [Candidatus Lokiarchaeota archaeon]